MSTNLSRECCRDDRVGPEHDARSRYRPRPSIVEVYVQGVARVPHARDNEYMPAFRDHFAFAASSYAAHRPHYPAALYEWLARHSPTRERAWDCGTGSGQAAVALAERFDHVVATDASIVQLRSANDAPGVLYLAMTAEAASLAADSMDLIAVAQALHWFDHERFFAEVDRILRHGGALAVWSYGLVSIAPSIDHVLQTFYHDTLGDYWPAERAMVDRGYADIALPYPEIPAPPFIMEAEWTLDQLGGFLSTWSAVGRYRVATHLDPLPGLMERLRQAWGDAPQRTASWPLIVRLARKP